MASELKVTWKKSAIGEPEDQRATVRSLGFRRLGQTVTLQDTEAIRGMLHKVRHLVEVESKD